MISNILAVFMHLVLMMLKLVFDLLYVGFRAVLQVAELHYRILLEKRSVKK